VCVVSSRLWTRPAVVRGSGQRRGQSMTASQRASPEVHPSPQPGLDLPCPALHATAQSPPSPCSRAGLPCALVCCVRDLPSPAACPCAGIRTTVANGEYQPQQPPSIAPCLHLTSRSAVGSHLNVAGAGQEAWPRPPNNFTGALYHGFFAAAATDGISRRARSIEEQLTKLVESNAPSTRLAAVLQE
jgi:hypothetical protein